MNRPRIPGDMCRKKECMEQTQAHQRSNNHRGSIPPAPGLARSHPTLPACGCAYIYLPIHMPPPSLLVFVHGELVTTALHVPVYRQASNADKRNGDE